MSKSFFDYFPPPQFLDLPFVGLDISPRAIRLVELKKDNGIYQVSRFGERLLEEPITDFENIASHEGVKKALQSLQREFKLKYVKATISEEKAFLFKTEVEGKTEDEIRTSIEFHLEENVPLSGEEALFDFFVFKKKGTGREEASVTVIEKKVVDALVAVFKECGITPLSFHLEPTAASRAVVKSGDTSSYIIVNLAETKTTISIESEGALQFTSTIPIGSESFTTSIAKQFNVGIEEAEKLKREKGFVRQEENSDLFFALANSVSVLKDEIERVYMYWHSHQDKNGGQIKKIEKILLCGKDSSLLGFKDHLSLSLKVPVEIGNVWINLFSFEDIIPSIPQSESLGYAAAIGLCLPKRK
jgi:type IV pilus assembly protein PilM